MARTEWLSEGAEKLAELTEGDAPHCDIAIVGSGYGGAVAAARLAGAAEEAGQASRVWVLERGREFLPGSFPEHFADLPGEVRIKGNRAPQSRGIMEGLFDVRVGQDVSALLANGLGGGSLINAGVLARPSPAVFARHPWPAVFQGGALEPCFERVERTLGGAAMLQRPRKLQSLAGIGRQLGVPARPAAIAVSLSRQPSVAEVPLSECVGCGDCFTGCNHRAKGTLATNYLPLAFRRGARLFTGVTVLTLQKAEHGWKLRWRFTDPQIAARFRGKPPSLIARRVILAAGTYGSTGILLRSKEAGLSQLAVAQLGKRFSTNGDMIAAGVHMPERVHAVATEKDDPCARNIGPTITGMVDLRDSGRSPPIVIEELAVPAALRRVFEEVVKFSEFLGDLARYDDSTHGAEAIDRAAIDPEQVERTAVYATIGDDGAKGVLRLADSAHADLDDHLIVDWAGVGDCTVFRGAMRTLEAAHETIGATLIPNPLWQLLPDAIGDVLAGGPIRGSVLTVHPLGGCAMAESGECGVVNGIGQVFKSDRGSEVHATLAVLDGSIVPTALGTNPCLTIAALAEHAVPKLAAEWNLRLEPYDRMPGSLPPAPGVGRQPWQAPRPTAIRLAERLTGTLRIPNHHRLGPFDAEIEIKYREVEDIERWLRQPGKEVKIAAATLTLTSTPTKGNDLVWCGTVELEGVLRVLPRQRTTAWARTLAALWAWLVNRGLRDLWDELCSRIFHRRRPSAEQPPKRVGLIERLRGWLAVASNAGERRLMLYRFTAVRDMKFGGKEGELLLAEGDRLTGRKLLAYVPGPWNRLATPWAQLTHLSLRLHRKGVSTSKRIGELGVDLPYFVRQFAAQLQIASQENQPWAIADLFSSFAYLARVIGKIHIWSLREPDYEDPHPLYELDEADYRDARAYAEKAGLRIEDRRGWRRPGEIRGLTREEIEVPCSPALLTRYRGRGEADKGRVLLIHGLGAAANTFTVPTIDKNLVQHLVAEGYEPWLLELRTSIARQSSTRDWSFEDVAFGDIPTAFDVAARWECSEPRPIFVVAHCIGAAMLSMAVLAGKLKKELIRAAVLSQVGPLLELPPANRFRGVLASYLKEYLRIDRFNITAMLTPFNRFVDRVLAAYPYPQDEWLAHHPLRFWQSTRHEAYCVRAYGIYGRLFEHRNLNHRTLDRLGDFLGHIRYKTYQQTIFYATMGRLTDELGRNRYVTYENILKHFEFPVCFLYGEKNEVFHPRTSERSFDLLASIFSPRSVLDAWKAEREKRYDYRSYSRGRQLRIVPIAGYGHQDCMIGRNAHKDVFPEITRFFEEARVEMGEKPCQPLVVRPARMGPIVGFARPAATKGKVSVQLAFAPNVSRSAPRHVLAFALCAGEVLVETARLEAYPHAGSATAAPATHAIDIELEADGRTYDVVLVTVHEEQYEPEPMRESGEPRPEDPFGEDLDRFPDAGFPRRPAVAGDLPAERQEGWLKAVLATCHDIDLDGRPLAAARFVSDTSYSSPLSAAVLTADVLRAGAPPDGDANEVRFALGSCRYAATFADRELADATFGRLRRRLELPADGRFVPQFLLLTGDQIYADATYGIFDPTLSVERYDQRYFECWTAPNAREVLRRVPVYPMLDDHELEENYEEGLEKRPGLIDAGKRAFETFQQKLVKPCDFVSHSPRTSGYSYFFSAAGHPFFVADTRTTRDRSRAGGPQAKIMHDDQMGGLKAWLARQPRTAPKFVVSPSVVVPWSRETRGNRRYALRSDGWDGYPDSVVDLFGFIVDEQIQNVVFLSGDFHISLFCTLRLAKPGRPRVKAYSIVSSGMYSPYPFANTCPDDLQLRFTGRYWKRWLHGPPRADDVVVSYSARPVDVGDSFAVVKVDRQAGRWRLAVEFDGAGDVATCAALL